VYIGDCAPTGNIPDAIPDCGLIIDPFGPNIADCGDIIDPFGANIAEGGNIPNAIAACGHSIDPFGPNIPDCGDSIDPSGPNIADCGNILDPSGPSIVDCGNITGPSGPIMAGCGNIIGPSGPIMDGCGFDSSAGFRPFCFFTQQKQKKPPANSELTITTSATISIIPNSSVATSTQKPSVSSMANPSSHVQVVAFSGSTQYGAIPEALVRFSATHERFESLSTSPSTHASVVVEGSARVGDGGGVDPSPLATLTHRMEKT